MKDNRFEQMWRDALENASENPPLHVWKHIDSKIAEDNNFDSIIASKFVAASEDVPSSVWNAIDSALENEKSFEEEFENVFASVSIAPPASLWDNIEAELKEEDERKPVIFLWSNKWIAGAIAAMLIALLSIPLLTNWFDKSTGSELSQVSNAASKKVAANIPQLNEKPNEIFQEELIGDSNNGELISKQSSTNSTPNALNALNSFSNNLSQNSNQQKVNVDQEINSQLPESTLFQNLVEKVQRVISSDEQLAFAEKKSYSKYGSSLTLKRKKLALPLSESEVELEKKDKSNSWLGFMSGLAPFDPNISITNFERQALVSAGNVPSSFFEYKSVVENTGSTNGNDAFEIPLSQPFNNIRTGSAINLGVDYGFKMAKNFSFQTGARYTRSSSFIQSNVYSYNPNTGNVSTFLESNYIAKENTNRNSTLISSAEDVKNAYQFLMIPVQLGYHVPVFNKIEISATGGISGDFLINNILDETPEAGSKLTPGNSAYKAFNLSGIGGLKVNYQVNENWDASIGANYQQALQSGVDASQNFSFRPKFFGVSYGINYKLN